MRDVIAGFIVYKTQAEGFCIESGKATLAGK
jgi:hypothetical protein